MDQLDKGDIVLCTRHLGMGSSPGHVTRNASMAQCKTAVSPLLTYWRYCGLALSYWYVHVFLSISRVVGVKLLTHWGREKMAAISQTIFSNAFSWVELFDFPLKFHWSLFPRFQLTISQHLVQIMAWRRPGDKPLSELMMVGLLTHIYASPGRNELITTAYQNKPYNNRLPSNNSAWHFA